MMLRGLIIQLASLWNPVKELKAEAELLAVACAVARVESGEGIESPQQQFEYHQRKPVESGEGIERIYQLAKAPTRVRGIR